MKYILLITSFIILNYFSFGQLLPKARIKKDSNKPGNYEVTMRASKVILNKGDSLSLDIFFTGYGLIGNSKIFLITSDSIFSNKSEFSFDIRRNFEKNRYEFGAHKIPMFKDNMIFASLSGLDIPDSTWHYPTMFFDADTAIESNMIFTEQYSGQKAPFGFNLISRKNAEGGDYNIKIYFTYYNGIEWKSSTDNVSIHINSTFEKYQNPLAILGLVFAFISVYPSFAKGSRPIKKYFKELKNWIILNIKKSKKTSKKVDSKKR